MTHWGKALEIVGLGDKLVAALFAAELIGGVAELYTLRQEDLAGLPRMGALSAKNVLEELEKSKTCSAAQVLVGLGLDDVGPAVAERLLDHLGSLAALRAASAEALGQIHGVGAVMAPGIVAALEQQKQRIDAILEHVTPTAAPDASDSTGPLTGTWVVFTGSLSSCDRKTAQAQARSLGANTPSGVLGQDHGVLVVGDRNSPLDGGEGRVSSKHAKARTQIRRGVDMIIISEGEWLTAIERPLTFSRLQDTYRGDLR